jgi:GNAT superfamily N-acetyltransferase
MKIENFTIDREVEVKKLALASWKNVYRDIFSEEEIQYRVDKFYSRKANEFIQSLIDIGVAEYKLLLDENESVIGFYVATVDEGEAELRRIYLNPSMIGKGFGTKMLKEAEKYFYNVYKVRVHKKNTLAIQFYLKSGFLKVGEEKEEDLMEKRIHGA